MMTGTSDLQLNYKMDLISFINPYCIFEKKIFISYMYLILECASAVSMQNQLHICMIACVFATGLFFRGKGGKCRNPHHINPSVPCVKMTSSTLGSIWDIKIILRLIKINLNYM